MSAQLVDCGAFESQDSSARKLHEACDWRVSKKIDDIIHPFLIVRETCLWNGGSQTGSCCPLRTEFGLGWTKGNIHGPGVVDW